MIVKEMSQAQFDNPVYQSFKILHLGYSVLPLVVGVDKFFHILTDWNMYLVPIFPRLFGIDASLFMLGVGIVEIVAGIITFLKPQIGGYVVAGWLLGIVVNLLLIPGFYDIAIRDFGLSLGALALARLSVQFREGL